MSGNVRYRFDATRPIGDRVDPADVLINGRPLDTTRRYRLAALAYTLVGGDGYDAFTGFTDPVRGSRDYEAFRAYLAGHSPVRPPAPGRVSPRH